MSVPTDTLYANQWHLNGTWGINVESAWDDWTGAGVKVGDFDDGIQDTHPDLSANYSHSLDYNSETGGDSGLPIGSDDNHGTAVGGLIAAARNGVGTVGVAYDATLVSIYQDFANPDDNDLVNGFHYARDHVDVMNNSWGFDQPYSDDFHGDFAAEGAALADAAANGRGGLGTIIVFSAGNDGDVGSDANYHNFNNSRFVIAVGATHEDGTPAYYLDNQNNHVIYTTPGSNVLVAAPGDDIWTTDRTGSAGYNGPGTADGDPADPDYTSLFGGTSASAGIVSGVVALMLQANPDLGWRDVQEILAYSARQTPDHSNYNFNGATNWNGGGLHFSDYTGAGLVDAHAAVRLAETWEQQSTSANELVASATASGGTLADVGHPGDSLQRTFTISSSIVVDRIELDVIDPPGGHSATGDLQIELDSPSGMPGLFVVGDAPDFAPPFGNGDDPSFTGTWTYDSVQFMGENADGVWTLTVSDVASQDSGSLGTFTLRVYGHAASSDDTYFYTDEFSDVFGQDSPGRATLSDDDFGTDTLNAAAVSGATTIDLTGGSSTIDGHSLAIDPQSIERVIGGDGGDLVTGGTAANLIDGERGADRLFGGIGSDTLEGSAGADTLSGDADGDLMLGDAREDAVGAADIMYGGQGADYLTGGAAKDVLHGDTEADWLVGGSGNDTLYGDADNDYLDGGNDNDLLYGGTGADAVFGGTNNDVAYGGDDNDWISGGANNDRSYGGLGDDILDMGTGNDAAYGGDGSDIAFGGQGDDSLYGDAGIDSLIGGDGIDFLYGGADNDVLSGGSQDDVFALLAYGGQDTVLDFEPGHDVLDLTSFNFADFDDFTSQGGVLGTIDSAGFQLIGVPGAAGDLALVHTVNGVAVTADDLVF